MDISEYAEGRIKKHEQTIHAKEDVQKSLFLEQRAMIKPVLCTYPVSRPVQAWMNAFPGSQSPVQEFYFPSEQTTHRIYSISGEKTIREIQGLFHESVPEVFIADGHHRCSAAAALHEEHPEKPFSRLLCAFFDAADLEIHNFNRVITHLNGFSGERFLEEVGAYCSVSPCQKGQRPAEKHEFLLLLDSREYIVHWKPELLEQPAENGVLLDVELLNTYLFGPILNIANVRNDPNILYIEGPGGVAALKKNMEKHEGKAAFCLYPVPSDDFFALVRAGAVMPPKSTWFEPRVKTGLIVAPWITV
ncbi:MAG: DUF1015 domain-containing protein [Haliscomenobacter sp.]|nr:DUF1015 domain-containing protein [Haliscomenobacter sp.]